MPKEINLEELLKSNLSTFKDNGFWGLETLIPGQKELILLAMKEVCQQTLELAVENAALHKSAAGIFNLPTPNKHCIIIGEDDDMISTVITLDKKSILKTINQIK